MTSAYKWLSTKRVIKWLSTMPPDSCVTVNAVGNLLVKSKNGMSNAYVEFIVNKEGIDNE